MFQSNTLNQAIIDVKSPLPRIPAAESLRRLSQAIPFPKTFPEFLRWTLVLAFLTLGISLYVWTSVLITQTEMQVAQLRAQHAQLEQENAQILWQISQYTSLERVQAQAQKRGYIPMAQRRYVKTNRLGQLVPAEQAAQTARPAQTRAASEDALQAPAWSATAQAAGKGLQSLADQASVWLVEQSRALQRSVQAWWQPVKTQLGQQVEKLNLSRFLTQEPPQ